MEPHQKQQFVMRNSYSSFEQEISRRLAVKSFFTVKTSLFKIVSKCFKRNKKNGISVSPRNGKKRGRQAYLILKGMLALT